MWAAISPQTWWYILASRSTNLCSFLQKHSQTHLKCSCVRLNSLYKKVIYEQHILSYYISILNFLIFSLTLLSSLRARPKEYLRESLYDHCGSTLTTHSTIGATLLFFFFFFFFYLTIAIYTTHTHTLFWGGQRGFEPLPNGRKFSLAPLGQMLSNLTRKS